MVSKDQRGTVLKVVTLRRNQMFAWSRCAYKAPTSHCNVLQELILIQIFLWPVKGGLPFQWNGQWPVQLQMLSSLWDVGLLNVPQPALAAECFHGDPALVHGVVAISGIQLLDTRLSRKVLRKLFERRYAGTLGLKIKFLIKNEKGPRSQGK